MARIHAPQHAASDAAEQAIASVLRAEQDARLAIDAARAEATKLAEAARADARTLTDRTERRIRADTGAFERELGARLAVIDAEARAAARPHQLTDEERAALRRAVVRLARELIGAAP